MEEDRYTGRMPISQGGRADEINDAMNINFAVFHYLIISVSHWKVNSSSFES